MRSPSTGKRYKSSRTKGHSHPNWVSLQTWLLTGDLWFVEAWRHCRVGVGRICVGRDNGPFALPRAGRLLAWGAKRLVPDLAAWTARFYGALRASSLSIWTLSKPTIQRLPILITGTPLCPVLRTRSREASASRSMLISLNGTSRSLK